MKTHLDKSKKEQDIVQPPPLPPQPSVPPPLSLCSLAPPPLPSGAGSTNGGKKRSKKAIIAVGIVLIILAIMITGFFIFKDGNPFEGGQRIETYIQNEPQQGLSGNDNNMSEQQINMEVMDNYDALEFVETGSTFDDTDRIIDILASNPIDMEKRLQTYFQKGDMEKAIDYTIKISVPNESTEMMKSMGSLFAEKMKQSLDEKGGLRDFKVTEISNDGVTAELNVEITYGDGTTDEQTATYIMVNGKWKKDK